MVVTKANPVGIDQPIQALQTALFEHLSAVWVVEPEEWNCYGRAYRNYKATGYIPEVYIGGNANDYADAFHNDKVTVTSFFGNTNGRSNFSEGLNTANIHLIFSVNLEALNALATRSDEEVRASVQSFLEEYLGTDIERITDIDRVYSEYTAWRSNDNMKFSDMHPKHCFRFNFNLTYDTYNCAQPIISDIN